MSQPIVFTAAGSGGHIFAAIATLKAFQKQYPSLAKEVIFIGSNIAMEGEKHKAPMEERICNRLGIPFRKIRMGKVQRQFSLRSIKLFLKIIIGFIDAYKLLRELRPSVIAAFGGYVSFPLVIVGKLLGVKIVLHEQTSSIGLTNKLLQPFADFIGVSFDTSVQHFKKPVTVVGSPTMEHMYAIQDYAHLAAYIQREESQLLAEPLYLEKLQWLLQERKKRKLIMMNGGSQGSHFLNTQIKAILPELLKDHMIIMQTGENEWYNDYQQITDYVASLPTELSQYCVVRKFMYEEFGFLMKNVDLFIARSGANTVYQAGMNHVPSIFVPIPWVTQNEQYMNAAILRDKGLAVIINQDECTPALLMKTINDALASKGITDAEVPVFALDADKKLAKEVAILAV
jgi:UDP-N-acetylglucosamine--N-acetylmuramyl-(pentapeptide) pyrophosphoryl-undecaprenol N-acetylglucosamine transferase